MKKTLIINFRRYGDILSSSHLVKDLKGEDPTQKIYMLTMKEFSNITDIMRGLEKVFTLDRKNILTLTQNKIYDDSRALNSFTSFLKPLDDILWDEIINYSNDKVGTYLCSYLKLRNPSAIVKGVYFDKHKNVISTSFWTEVFNEVITTYKHTPFHFTDLYRKSAGVKFDDNFWKAPITTERNNNIAAKNFSQIRNHQAYDGKPPLIIGIQLKASSDEKEIEEKEIIGLINTMFDNPSLYPVLLIAPFENEKKQAEKISDEFGNTLVIVEADINALPSVIKELDLLITPDTLIKHLGDLLDLPMVEVSRGSSPLLKQGTCTPGNYILSSHFSTRFNSRLQEKTIKASDIYQCVEAALGFKDDNEIELSNGVVLYKSIRDDYGLNYKYIGGMLETDHELSRFFSRQYLENLESKKSTIKISNEILKIDTSEIRSWISAEMTHLTHATRALLSTIRDLKQAQANPKSGVRFAESLDKLISFAEASHICSIPIALFRGRLDSLFQPNKEKIETLAYNLKNDLQIALKSLKGFDDDIQNIEKDILTSKYSRIVENSINEFIN